MRSIATLGKCVALLAICVLQANCGGDDCQSCSTVNSCPSITKQCPGYTATVQQCSGASGGKMCCAKSAAEISCTALSESAGSYSVTEGIVSFSPSDGQQCLHYWIDAGDNGWVNEGMSRPEQEAMIRSKMAEVNPGSVPR